MIPPNMSTAKAKQKIKEIEKGGTPAQKKAMKAEKNRAAKAVVAESKKKQAAKVKKPMTEAQKESRRRKARERYAKLTKAQKTARYGKARERYANLPKAKKDALAKASQEKYMKRMGTNCNIKTSKKGRVYCASGKHAWSYGCGPRVPNKNKNLYCKTTPLFRQNRRKELRKNKPKKKKTTKKKAPKART